MAATDDHRGLERASSREGKTEGHRLPGLVEPSAGPPAPPGAPARRRRDWTAQLRASLHTADDLAAAFELTPAELAGARRAEQEGLPIRVTPYYLSLCD